MDIVEIIDHNNSPPFIPPLFVKVGEKEKMVVEFRYKPLDHNK